MATDPAAAGPLAGITVIEIGRYIAAPYACQQLADLGATVIKVEEPTGDPFRAWDETGVSPTFLAYNRGKRSVVANLRQPAESERVARMIGRADVVVENNRPGALNRLGLGPEAMLRANPRLIYCSINAFGSSGPMAARPGFDTIISCLSGLYSQLMDPQEARPAGPAFSDLTAGLFAAQAVLAALLDRTRTGQGQAIEVPMVSVVAAGLLVEPAMAYLRTGVAAQSDTRMRRAHAFFAVTRDDRPIAIHLSAPTRFWTAFVGVLGIPELRDNPRFANRTTRIAAYYEISALIRERMKDRDFQEWSALLAAADIPHAPILDMGETLEAQDLAHLQLVVGDSAPGADDAVPGHPYALGRSRSVHRSAPMLDADSGWVATWLETGVHDPGPQGRLQIDASERSA